MFLKFATLFFSLLFLKISANNEDLPSLGIVGGTKVNESIPYQISLEFLKEHHCGGSIIRPDIIITAAHCTHGNMKRFLRVRAGSLEREEDGQVVNIKNFINHPQFNRKTYDYDISIIQLEEPIKFNKFAASIKIPEQDEKVPYGKMGIISGWGYVEEKNKDKPKFLRSANVALLNRETCGNNLSVFTPRMICAGTLSGGIDACQADSGGPLVAEGKLYGIISWGVGCGRPNNPGVYTNVASLRNWIDETNNELS